MFLTPQTVWPTKLVVTVAIAVMPTASLHGQQPTDTSSAPLAQLEEWLTAQRISKESLKSLLKQSFANLAISKSTAESATKKLWKSRRGYLKTERSDEMENRKIVIGSFEMPFWFKAFGQKPEFGRSLFISMHGGGGAPARVNDQQYENQKKLYRPAEGIYLVPRAPTNAWNLWHQAHIDEFFDRLITNMIVFEDVNPDRVYLMGYSAGGDGVYQLAPRMADRLAAASMMAGHPNETKPDGLRNLPFCIHVGARDSAYDRNRIAGEWKTKLGELQTNDPGGYQHYVELHSGRGHWMNLKDAVALPWMAEFTRKRFPRRIVWQQDDVTHERFYWLKMSKESALGRPRVVATCKDNNIQIDDSDVEQLTVLMHDDLLDLDNPLTISADGKVLFKGAVKRTIGAIASSLLERDDPRSVVYATVDVETLSNAGDVN